MAPPWLMKNEAESGGKVILSELGWWCQGNRSASTPPELPWPLPCG